MTNYGYAVVGMTIFLKMSPYKLNIYPLMWPEPTPRDHDLNKLESAVEMLGYQYY